VQIVEMELSAAPGKRAGNTAAVALLEQVCRGFI
jgi:hypothetical protein